MRRNISHLALLLAVLAMRANNGNCSSGPSKMQYRQSCGWETFRWDFQATWAACSLLGDHRKTTNYTERSLHRHNMYRIYIHAHKCNRRHRTPPRSGAATWWVAQLAFYCVACVTGHITGSRGLHNNPTAKFGYVVSKIRSRTRIDRQTGMLITLLRSHTREGAY